MTAPTLELESLIISLRQLKSPAHGEYRAELSGKHSTGEKHWQETTYLEKISRSRLEYPGYSCRHASCRCSLALARKLLTTHDCELQECVTVTTNRE